MIQRKNTLYLLRMYIPWLILWLIEIILLAIYIPITLSKSALIFCISFIIIFGLILVISVSTTLKKQSHLLQSESAQSVIKYFANLSGPAFMARIYNQLFSMVLPLWKPSQAYRNALIYSYYGNFETAREELQKVEWGKYPPFVQSEKKYIEALAAFLEKKDFKQGLDLAKEALKLHEFASYIPGRRYLYLRFTTLIGIGQLLNGDQDTTILTSLEKEFRRYPVFSKVLIAFGLEKAYNQIGDIHQAEQMRAFINDTAPHCVALVNNSVPKGPKDL